MYKKILIVDDLEYNFYEKSIGYGFTKIGYKVFYFKSEKSYKINSLFNKFSKFYNIYLSKKIDIELLKKVETVRPNVILFWRALSIKAKTFSKIKIICPKIKIILHHNDNPFLNKKIKIKNGNFFKSIKLSDLVLAYRKSDFIHYKKYKAKKIKLFLPYIYTKIHKPFKIKKKIDVIFIGHYENDGRLQIIKELHENKINYKIYGNNWEKIIRNNNKLKIYNKEYKGLNYSKKLSSAKIALVFVSKENNDVYTRRCYEIPACKTLLFAQKTKELNKILKENNEAVYWKNDYEFVNKIKFLLKNKQKIKKISKLGYLKIVNNGNSEFHRAKEIISY